MNSAKKGIVSDEAVTLALLKCGYTVLRPLGDYSRYDLVVEVGDRFYRVQCKTGRIRRGVIEFATCSVRINTRQRITRAYDAVDFFGVYCGELDRVYLVPVDEVGTREATLCFTPARNGQLKRIRRAEEYEVRKVEPGGIEPPTFRLQTERSPS